MSNRWNFGVNNVAKSAQKAYVGVDNAARGVIKGYVGVNNIARMFFLSRFFEYTGEYTEQEVTIDGKPYILYTLIKSGILTCSDSQFWMCGGGGGGAKGNYGSAGGGGGGGYVNSGKIAGGTHEVVIGNGGAGGSDGGATSIGQYIAEGGKRGNGKNGGDGGSGGGAADDLPHTLYVKADNYGTPGNGAGVETYPFGLKNIEGIYAHCAGGAGGNAEYKDKDARYNIAYGMTGGTNGGNGGIKDSVLCYDGKGGEHGGGNSLLNATYYGGGGGGGECYQNDVHVWPSSSCGAGYQGVAYILQRL